MANQQQTSPLRHKLSAREKFVSSIMAFLAMLLVGLLSIKTVGIQGLPYMVASMGASSVLLFAVPHSPLSQPWPLVGGHLISSTVGVTCLLLIPEPVLAGAAAVSLAIAGMHIGRCLHPPGGAVALATVLGGQQVASLGYMFVAFPVLLNTLLMLGAALLLNNMVPGRRYPAKRRLQEEGSEPWTELGYGLSGQDLRSAVSSLEEFVDVGEEQLDKMYKAMVVQMRKRQLGDVRCAQIMSRDVICFNEKTPLSLAWSDLQNLQIKAAPIVDQQKRLLGIITQADLAKYFMEKVSNNLSEEALVHLQQTPMGLVMTTPVTSIDVNSHVVDTLAIFLERKIHHLPVVDSNRCVLGMLTRTDLLTLLQQNQSDNPLAG